MSACFLPGRGRHAGETAELTEASKPDAVLAFTRWVCIHSLTHSLTHSLIHSADTDSPSARQLHSGRWCRGRQGMVFLPLCSFSLGGD